MEILSINQAETIKLLHLRSNYGEYLLLVTAHKALTGQNSTMKEVPTYNGEPIPAPIDRWSIEEKLALLDWHPIFTGRCPHCEHPISLPEPPAVHWDCQNCDWVDDTV